MLDLGSISINRVGKHYDINVIKADTNIRESSLVSRYSHSHDYSTSRSISISSVRNATRAANCTHFIIHFFFFFSITSLCETPHERTIYIYIRIRRSSISKFSRGRERCGEKRCDCFTSTTRRSTHFDSGSISGSTRRGGWFDRSIEDGWILGRDPPRRNSCRGSSDSGGPRRAE